MDAYGTIIHYEAASNGSNATGKVRCKSTNIHCEIAVRMYTDNTEYQA